MGLFSSGRGGASREVLALRGLMLLAVFAALVLVMSLSMKGAFRDTATVTTRLDTAGGAIAPGSDVKVAGLVVGRVSSITGDERGVDLRLEIDSDKLDGIPSTVRSRVLPATVFGTTYVDLVRKGAAGRDLRAGDRIAQDTSVPTLELQKALDSIDRVVDALGPAELNTALSSLAGALDGRGDELGAALEDANRLLRRLEDDWPLVREDLALLVTNLDTVSRAAPDLLDAVDDALVVGGHLVDRKADLATMLTGSLALVREGDTFLKENERQLVRVLSSGAIATDAFHDGRRGLRAGLLAVIATTDNVVTIGEGGRMRMRGRIVQPDYPNYTAADCPRYGRARGGNCPGSGRTPVGALVGGRLLAEEGRR